MPPSHEPGSPSATARELARHLLSAEANGGGSAPAEAESVNAAERLCLEVTGGLSRWFGPFGSQALVARALATVQEQHPVMRDVQVTGTACLSGLPDTARSHGATATTDAVVEVMAELAALIGRLIGDDLAISLLQQSMTMSSTSGRAAPDAVASGDVPQTVNEP